MLVVCFVIKTRFAEYIDEDSSGRNEGRPEVFCCPWKMYTGWYLWVTLWKYYSNASKICQCESKADNLLCLVDWVGLYVWRLRNILLFFSSQYLCCIVCLEEKAKIRGGLELESFSINLPRITTLWFLSLCLCAEVAVISSRVHVWLFSTLLQHPFIYLKVRPYPYINFFPFSCIHFLPKVHPVLKWESFPVKSSLLPVTFSEKSSVGNVFL